MLRGFLLIWLLNGHVDAAPLFKPDLLQTGSSGYQLLQSAVIYSGASTWIGRQLKNGVPLPNALARELALELIRTPAVPSALRASLKKEFEPETKPVDEAYDKLIADAAVLDERIGELQARLDRYEKESQRSILNKASRPSVLAYLWANFGTAASTRGLMETSRQTGPGGGVWAEFDIAGEGYQAAFSINADTPDYPAGYSGFTFGSFGLQLHFDPGIDIGLGDEGRFGGPSSLIYGSPSSYIDDFSRIDTQVGRYNLVAPGSGGGAYRYMGDLSITKTGPFGWWWPFDNSSLIVTQSLMYPFTTEKLREIAGGVGFNRLRLFWPFEFFSPKFSFMWSANDQADLNSNYPAGSISSPRQNSTAQALGMVAEIKGGGTLGVEFATAEWQREDIEKSYRDHALNAYLTKSLWLTSIHLGYQHTGPGYFPAGREQLSAVVMDISHYPDERPGKPKNVIVWETDATEPNVPWNNSEHMHVGLDMNIGFFNFGFMTGTNQQIEASGPWLRSAHVLGWFTKRQTRAGQNGSHGLDLQVDPAIYNSTTKFPGNAGVANFQNQSMALNWISYGPNSAGFNKEMFYLTQKGVGDPNLRADSVKFLNYAEARSDIDLQALFGLSRPFMWNLSWRLRNTDETLGFPSLSSPTLLTQSIAASKLVVELPADLHFACGAGYETWSSMTTYLPVEYYDTWGFVNASKYFPDILRNFSIGPTFAYLRHRDVNLMGRGFETWRIVMTSTTNF